MTRITPYLLLLALCAVLFFWRLGGVPLMGMDEGVYAGCAREMAASGNYVVPMLNGRPFFDKPPVVFWLQAASIREFGVNSFAPRLPSAIAALALVFLTVFLGSRLFDRHAGLLAGFAVACTLLTVGLARMCLLDQLFALTIAASLGAFILCHVGALPRRVYLLFWAAMGLSVMVKGPAGAALIIITVAVFLLIRRRTGEVAKMMPIAGVLIALAIALPWYVLVQRATGGAFLGEFLIHQNIQRALGQDFHHNMPFFFYIPVFLVGFFPWSVFVPFAWTGHVRLRPKDKTGEAALFLATWMVTVIAVFSLCRSALPAYIFPSFPAAALLVGLGWSRAAESGRLGSLTRYAAVSVVFAAIIGGGSIAANSFMPRLMPGLGSALTVMGVSLIAGTVAAYVLLRLRRQTGAFAALCGGMAAFLLAAVGLGLPVAAKSKSAPLLAAAQCIHQTATTKEQVLSYRLPLDEPGLLGFYAQRPIPDHKTRPELSRALASYRRCLVIARRADIKDLPQGGKPVAKVNQYLLYRFE